MRQRLEEGEGEEVELVENDGTAVTIDKEGSTAEVDERQLEATEEKAKEDAAGDEETMCEGSTSAALVAEDAGTKIGPAMTREENERGGEAVTPQSSDEIEIIEEYLSQEEEEEDVVQHTETQTRPETQTQMKPEETAPRKEVRPTAKEMDAAQLDVQAQSNNCCCLIW
mmetsp:Transcript_7569/g.18782  ORF Transcript_7569/g.18782 Transcript_7569/m.18782 type:complete len:169 (-) Transcript_7569:190-696(-)